MSPVSFQKPINNGRLSRRPNVSLGGMMAACVLLSVAIMIYSHTNIDIGQQPSEVESIMIKSHTNFDIGQQPSEVEWNVPFREGTKMIYITRNYDQTSAQHQQQQTKVQKRKLSRAENEEIGLAGGSINKAFTPNRQKGNEAAMKAAPERKAITMKTAIESVPSASAGQQGARKESHKSSSLEMPSPSSLEQQLPFKTKEEQKHAPHTGGIPNQQTNSINPVDAKKRLKTGSSEVPPPSSLSKQPPKNKNVVHIIQSKLLQHQPDLVALGRAQLELYAEICLKSLQQQTSNNFYHVLRTDPELHESIKEPLIRLLRSSNVRHVLLAVRTPRLDLLYEWAVANATKETVWSGDFDDFSKYLVSSDRVIETWLDSDDGLGSHFVEEIQNQPIRSFPFQRHTYKFVCAGSSVDWSVNNMFDTEYDPQSPGILFPKTEHHCVTAGWSAVFSSKDIASRPFRLFHINHMEIFDNNPPCNDGESVVDSCVERLSLPNGEYSAIRARTPTSMNLRNVGTQRSAKHEAEFQKIAAVDVQNGHWEQIQNDFGFAKEVGGSLFQLFISGIHGIAKENLRACKREALLKCPQRVKQKLWFIMDKFPDPEKKVKRRNG